MKKVVSNLFLALLTLIIVAGASQAATVYDKDGLTYDIKGDWQIQLRQDPGTNQELDVEYDDLEIKNSINYKISENLSAFGQLDFGFKNAADKKDDPATAEDENAVHLEEAYVGLDFGVISVLVGKTGNAADEFGVEAAYESIIAEDVFDEYTALDGDDLIKAEAKIGEVVSIVLAHEVSSDSEASGNEEFTDIFVGAEFAGLEIGAVYQTYEDDVLAPTKDVSGYGFSLMYDAKVVKVGADYSALEDDLDSTKDQSMVNAVVIVPVVKSTKIALGYVNHEFDNAPANDVEAWYANVTHKLNKKVSAFAELTDDDTTGSDMGYMAGLRLKF